MRRLLIMGAGGHAAVAYECALAMGRYDGFLFSSNEPCGEGPFGHEAVSEALVLSGEADGMFDEAFVAVGDNAARALLLKRLGALGVPVATLVHPSACASPSALIGRGSIVCARASVGPRAAVGEGCIVNTGAVVEHDCQLGGAVHMSPVSAIGGGTAVGDRSWLCIGSCASDHLQIGSDVVLGAGACLVGDASLPGTYVGIPAHLVGGAQ